MIVDDRDLLGYPGSRAELHVECDGSTRVVIEDGLGLTEWKPRDRKQALDMFKHPFAYGYNAPIIVGEEVTV